MKMQLGGAIALAILLSACGEPSPTGAGGPATAAEEVSPRERFADITQAYNENGIRAKRTWGGKRVVVAGTFFSSGRNTDGTASILLTGPTPTSIGDFNVGRDRDNYVAALKKGEIATLECTVDSSEEGFSTKLLKCDPVKTTT